MEYFDHYQWVSWPECDVRKYANEIAGDHSLSSQQSSYLEAEMVNEAGYWPAVAPIFGPFKMDQDTEKLFRALGNEDKDVLKQNRRDNSPLKHSIFREDAKLHPVGRGLTRRQFREIKWESPALKKQRRRAQRRAGRHPFTSLNPSVQRRAQQALWAANCYPFEPGAWLMRRGADAPLEGLAWFAAKLLEAYHNARDQAHRGNVEGALWHAFRAGTFCTELEIVATHGPAFEKHEAVTLAQRHAAQSRKLVPDELRREAYWRYRRDGHKRIEAGKLAAQELGLSEGSIRNAFPDRKYPPD